MSYKSRAQVMRDRDDLEEQRWQPATSGPSRDNDPLAELARIVGQATTVPQARAEAPPPQAADAAASQQDWINEIERAFAQVVPPSAVPPTVAPPQVSSAAAPQQPADDAAQVPAWLRSPAVPQTHAPQTPLPQVPVPQIPLPEGASDPRVHPDAFAQDFSRALDEASASGRSAYHAQDPYQLAAAGPEGFNAAHVFPPYSDAQPQVDAARDAAGHSGSGYGVYDDLEDEYRAGAVAAEDEEFAYGEEAPPRRRKFVAAALALGLGALAVAGVFMFRGGEQMVGEPPIVTADSQPVKVEPETPGGVEVPNTNRAIYEHTNEAPSGEGAVVVDNREQPVDISQMIAEQNAAAEARAIEQRAALATTTITNETTTAPPVEAADVALPEAPEPTSPAIAALGEPRRVRTVSVRPDGSILPTAPEAPTAAEPTIDQLASATPSVASPTTPSVSSPEAPAVAETQAPAVTPTVGPVPRPASVNRPATRAPLQLGPMAISPQSAGSRVASAPVPAAQPAQASQPATAGSFTVQLAAPGSENEARNLFATLQRRHGELSGYSPNIIRAETGGRTIYRLRVGAFQSRDQATALCVRIQAAGGQCFVARN